MQNVRIFFEKTGMAKYISHLDLMRCMTRAVRRSEIPVWYTEGYNPHLFMTFALPLSLGIESVCESLEIRITEDIAFDEIKNKLNDNLPDGIRVTAVDIPVGKPEEIAFAVYKITFYTLKNEKIKDAIESKLSSDNIPAEKIGKQGKRKVLKTINLKEFVDSFDVLALNEKVMLTITLSAGSKNNINPNLLIDALNLGEDVNFTTIFKENMLTFEQKDFK